MIRARTHDKRITYLLGSHSLKIVEVCIKWMRRLNREEKWLKHLCIKCGDRGFLLAKQCLLNMPLLPWVTADNGANHRQ